MISSKALSAHRAPTCVRCRGRSGSVRVQALFGWGKKKEDEYDYAKEEKEAAFQAQQELLAKRRTGVAITEAEERRSNVKKTMAARKAERKNERDLLAQGIMPESYSKWKPYEKKEDAEGTSGIVVPLLPFGMRKYDEGERFDLRSPYSDMGWVDPEETDMMSGLKNWSKKLLNFSGRDLDQQGKPIIWASDYQKYKEQRKQEGKE